MESFKRDFEPQLKRVIFTIWYTKYYCTLLEPFKSYFEP